MPHDKMSLAMRAFLCVLTLTLAFSGTLCPAATREERKEAAAWVKAEIGRRQKALALLTKVKDEGSAVRSGRALASLYSSTAGGATVMGDRGASARPAGEVMEREEKRNVKRIEKLKAQMAAEKERIEALELDCPELEAALELMESEP